MDYILIRDSEKGDHFVPEKDKSLLGFVEEVLYFMVGSYPIYPIIFYFLFK